MSPDFIPHPSAGSKNPASSWQAAGRRFNKVWDDFTLFLYAWLLIVASLQVLARYVLVTPVPWTEELARFLLVWVSFLGAASVTRRKLHITVDFVAKRFPARFGAGVNCVLHATIFLFLVILFLGSLEMFGSTWPVHAGTMPWLSISWVYLGAILGLAYMLVVVLGHLVQGIKNFLDPSQARPWS